MRAHLLFCSTLLALAATALSGSLALAAPVTVMGLNLDLTYDDQLLGDFSAPTLVGDSIFFTLNRQRAESTNGIGQVLSTAQLSGLVIVTRGGYRFSGFDLAAFGDYRLTGAGSAVGVSGQLRAFDANLPGAGRAVADLALLTAMDRLDGANHDWVAAARIDGLTPMQGGGAQIVAAGVQAVGLEIRTTLSAYTDAGAIGQRQAFIENKFAGLQITARPAVTVPAPGTLALVLLALAGLAGLRRLPARRAG